MSTRLVIADDHAIWRSGLRADLGEAYAVVGEAGDGAEAIEVIRRERPDLALVDLHMDNGGGMAVVTACAAECPIVILTVSEAERDLLGAVAAGAVGYLTKSTRPEELRLAVARAAAGEPVFSPQLAGLVIGEFRRLAASGSDSTQGLSPASARWWGWWRGATPTRRWPMSSSSRPRRWRTTSATSWPSSTCRAVTNWCAGRWITASPEEAGRPRLRPGPPVIDPR